MDLEYELATLDSKLSDLGDQCGKVNNISNDYNGSSLKKLSGTEIASLSSKLTASIERLQKAYTNCNNWFSGFDSELKSLEETLTAMKGKDGAIPEDFKETFSDLFTKVAVPVLTTKYRKEQEEKKKSGVLDYKVGKVPEKGVEAANLARIDAGKGGRATLLDFQVNGVSLGQDGEITIKRGQQVKVTVSMPEEIPDVDICTRTSAHGGSGHNTMVEQHNSPSVDRYNSSTFTKMRSYTWYITGQKTGQVTLSQTAEFSLTGKHKHRGIKAMCRLRVKIVD